MKDYFSIRTAVALLTAACLGHTFQLSFVTDAHAQSVVPLPPLLEKGEYARGVPYPDFGWDPLTYSASTQRSTDSLPTIFEPGDVIEYSGTRGGNVEFRCTVERPCILRGQNQILSSTISATGTHFVVENFRWFNEGGVSLDLAQFASIRSNECFGDNSGTSNGTAMSATFAENIVYFQNTIRNRGNLDPNQEIDYHGFKPRHGNKNIWYLDNTSFNLGGDSIQAGTNVSRLGGNPFSESIWIARNDFHDNGENPIDIKAATNVIISQNDLYGAKPVGSSAGEIIVIHESGDNVYIYDNQIHDGDRGVVTATSGGGATYIAVDGNKFFNLTTYGVYNRGGGHADVTNNIFTGIPTPIENNSDNGSTVTESNNTFN